MGFFSNKKTNIARIDHSDLISAPYAKFSNLPHAYREAGKNEIDIQAYRTRLERVTNHPVQMLEQAASILTSLNITTMKPAQRLEITNMIFSQVYPALAIWYYKYMETENSLPESKERRATLVACIGALNQLAIAYQHYFRDLFSIQTRKVKKVQESLSLAGFRIMEVLLIKQRIYALRYQKLPQGDWNNCNNIFFSMAFHNMLDHRHGLKGSIGLRGRSSTELRKGVLETTIRRLYLSVQLFGIMDVSTWPIRLFQIPDAYLEYLGEKGLKFALDDGEPLQPGFLYADLYQSYPMRPERAVKKHEPSALIDYTGFFNTLVKDHEEIGKMKFISNFDGTKISRPLLKLNEEDRIPVLDMMLMAFHPRKRKQKRHTVFSDEVVKVYFGKNEVMQLLTDTSHGNLEQVAKSRKFIDTLAQQSAILANDDNLHMRAAWRIVNFSTGGLLIRTRETGFNNPVQLGQVMAFTPEDNISKATVSVVVRLQRHDDGFVEVAVQSLSTEAEVAFLFDQARPNNDSGNVCILYRGMDDNWSVITSPAENYVPGMPFSLVRDKGERILLRLGDVLMSKKEFVVFEVRSPALN
ncbi:MAG: hypothetical protein OQK73_05350 [Gammaproteobacteria bacterium]|nr:hypothetical protein [Gammaproteobacteria bacterium]